MASRRGGASLRRFMRALYFAIRKGRSRAVDFLTGRAQRSGPCSHGECNFAMRKMRELMQAHEDRLAGASHLGDLVLQRRDDPRARPRSVRGAHRHVTFTDHVWLLVTGRDAERRAATRARCNAGCDRGARAGAERAGEPHDACGGARSAAGRSRCGNSRLRLGDSRRYAGTPGDLLHEVVTRAAAGSLDRGRCDAGRAGVSRRAARDSRLRPSAAQRLPIRASYACSKSPPQRVVSGRHVEAAHAVERVLPARLGKQLAMNVSGAIPAVLLDAGYPLAALKGVPILARTAEPDRASARRAEPADRIRALARRRSGDRLRRPGAGRLRGARSVAIAHEVRPVRHPHRRAGHLHHRAVRRNDARGPRRRRRQGRKSHAAIRIARTRADSSRRTSRPTTATSAASRSICNAAADRAVFDDLVAQRRRLHPELPSRHGRATRCRRAAAAGAQSDSSSTARSAASAPSGPYADRPSYDSVAQALSGFLSVVVDPDRPRFLGPALADAITGIYAAYGVLGALFERSRTGRGRLVEVSMLEAMAHFAVEPFAAFFALDRAPKSSDRPRLAQAYILRTADGGLIAIHLSSLEKFWEGLVSALACVDDRQRRALPHAAGTHRQLRGARRGARCAVLAPHAAALGRASRRATTCRSRPSIASTKSSQDPQVRHLGLIVPVERAHGGKHAVRPAVQFDGTRATHVTHRAAARRARRRHPPLAVWQARAGR